MSELFLPDALRTELLVYAREAHPEEACGLLIGTVQEERYSIFAVRFARNLHPQRENRYYLDPLEYARAEKYCLKHAQENWKVLGFWHSHPNSPPQPSEIDLRDARELEHSFPARYLYLIVSLQDANVPDIACWCLDVKAAQFEAVPVSGL